MSVEIFFFFIQNHEERVKYCMKNYNLAENGKETQLHMKCAFRKVDVPSLLW